LAIGRTVSTAACPTSVRPLFLDEEDDIRRYTLMFGHLRAAALRPQATAAALAAIAAPA
jgi:Domain of unknown function (DUF5753)